MLGSTRAPRVPSFLERWNQLGREAVHRPGPSSATTATRPTATAITSRRCSRASRSHWGGPLPYRELDRQRPPDLCGCWHSGRSRTCAARCARRSRCRRRCARRTPRRVVPDACRRTPRSSQRGTRRRCSLPSHCRRGWRLGAGGGWPRDCSQVSRRCANRWAVPRGSRCACSGSRPTGAGPGGWRSLFAPFATTFGYFTYLRVVTGDWLAWSHAQAQGWDRHLHRAVARVSHLVARRVLPRPGLGLRVGVSRRDRRGLPRGRADARACSCCAVGARRRSSGCRCSGSPARRTTSRSRASTLMWFPLWLLLARWSVRWQWLHIGYLAVAPALMAVGVLTFTSGRWLG